MKSYAQDALETLWAFRAGIYSIEDVVWWADAVLAQANQYDDAVANISLSAKRLPQEIDSMLLHASEGADRIQAIRHLLGQMHGVMLLDQSRGRDFTRVIDRIVVECGYHLPQDLNFLFGLEDEFDMAEDGTYGTVSGVTDAFIKRTELYSRQEVKERQPIKLSATSSGWSRIRQLVDLMGGRKRKEHS